MHHNKAPTVAARENTVRVAERVLDKLRIQVRFPNGVIQIGCTVGIAVYPADATDSQGLLTLADRLMYTGKKSGRNRLVTVDDVAGKTHLPLPKRRGAA